MEFSDQIVFASEETFHFCLASQTALLLIKQDFDAPMKLEHAQILKLLSSGWCDEMENLFVVFLFSTGTNGCRDAQVNPRGDWLKNRGQNRVSIKQVCSVV